MLLIEHPSGVVYENQVGGNACWQATLEGVLAPLDMESKSFEEIMNLFDAYAPQGITAMTADAIDAILVAEPVAKTVRVDRERLAESWEAWVYVIVDFPASVAADADLELFSGFGKGHGVLTWPNSD